MLLVPGRLDALDCLALDYCVGWPLSAVLPEVGGGGDDTCKAGVPAAPSASFAPVGVLFDGCTCSCV